MSKEDVRRFFRNRFSQFIGDEDHPALNIDPEEHQPDEEHTDEAAKNANNGSR